MATSTRSTFSIAGGMSRGQIALPVTEVSGTGADPRVVLQ